MTEAVRVVSDEELQEATGTPGLHRRVAFESEGYWSGHVEATPQTMSGWHHHGDNDTIGYVLEGQIRIEYGPGGRQRADIRKGDFFKVPAGLIHREGNALTRPSEIVIARIGEGPPVFPVDGPESD